jgi:two-component system chemotaxis response regulator CheY
MKAMKRILIVDDAATVRMYHRAILESAGYAVDEAINGMEALEKALTTAYDLFLVDVNMPKMDGYAFLTDLRGHPDLAQPPAVMISTEAELVDRTKAYAAGANFYMVKPTRPDSLIGHVRVLLGSPPQ